MLIKIAVGILAVLLLRIFWPSLVRGTRRILLAFAVAAVVFGAVVWLTAS